MLRRPRIVRVVLLRAQDRSAIPQGRGTVSDSFIQSNDRYLIVNADDFGMTRGINRGIVECHRDGVLTSTSLMVTGKALDEAVALSRDNPKLAIGLHFDVWGEDEREFDTHDIAATRDEFHRQLDAFVHHMGR